MKDPFAYITEELQNLSISNGYDDIITRAATKYGIPDKVPIIQKMLQAESSGNSKAVSPKGARGLMQLMPGTARAMGVKDLDDPEQNIFGGVKYLKEMYDKFGDDTLAVAAYNAGPGAVQRAGGVPKFKETQNYVQKVLSGQGPVQAPTASPSQAFQDTINKIQTNGIFYGSGKQKSVFGDEWKEDCCGGFTTTMINRGLKAAGVTEGLLPTSNLGTGQPKYLSEKFGSPLVGGRGAFTPDILKNMGEGTVIAGDKPSGGNHAEMIVRHPQTGELVVASYGLKGQTIQYKQINDGYASKLNAGKFQATNPFSAINPNASNMVADVTGQTVPANIQNQQPPEKRTKISEILSGLAASMGPTAAEATPPPEKSLGDKIIQQEMDPFARITSDIQDPFAKITAGIPSEPQPQYTTGQQIARTVAPYTKIGLPLAGMTLAGIAASPTLATPAGLAAEAGALGYGAYVGNKAQSLLEEFAGLKQPPQNVTEALTEEGKRIAGSGIEAMSGQVGAKVLNKALGYLADDLAPRMYQYILKPSTTLKFAERKRLMNWGLDEKITISTKGAEKLDGLMQTAQNHIDDLVSAGTKRGGLISTKSVVKELDELIKNFKQTDTPSIYIQKIKEYRGQLLKERAIMSPDEAHEIKKNMWKILDDATFSKEFPELGQKMKLSFGQGLKVELEKIIPGLKELNADQGMRIEFMKLLNKAIGRIDNRYPVSLYDVVAGSAVGAATDSAGKGIVMTILSKVLLDPKVNSFIAMALKRTPTINYQGLLGRGTGLVAGQQAEQKIGEKLPSWKLPELSPYP